MLNPGRIYSLQAYRAVAAILVVTYHVTAFSRDVLNISALSNIFAFGYVGVDFFFVLSGFIILYTHERDIGHPAAFRNYMVRRLIRIYPILWMVTIAKLVAIVAYPAAGKPYERDLSVIVSSLLLIPQANEPVIGAAWTLSYEMAFYILFGVAICVGMRAAVTFAAAWGLVVLGQLAYRIAVGPDHFDSTLTRFIFNERHLEFLMGCLGAYVIRRRRLRFDWLLVLAGLAWFVISSAVIYVTTDLASYAFMIGLPSLLIVVGTASLELRGRVRVPGPLAFLGDASYSIYLCHAGFINLFVLIVARSGVRSNPLLIIAIMTVFSVMGGVAVYRFVERPMLQYLRRTLLRSRPRLPVVAQVAPSA